MSDKKKPPEDKRGAFQQQSVIPVMSLADFKVKQADVLEALTRDANDLYESYLRKVQMFHEQ